MLISLYDVNCRSRDPRRPSQDDQTHGHVLDDLVNVSDPGDARALPRKAPSRGLSAAQKVLVGRGGLEPPTSRLSGVRSNHLSYRPYLGGA
jgi:hypothetical protein